MEQDTTALPRPALIAAVMLLAAFAVLAVRASGPTSLPLDVRFLTWIQTQSWPAMDHAGTLTNWLFDGLPVSILLISGVLILLIRRRHLDAITLMALGILKLMNGVLKDIVQSPRPDSSFNQETEPFTGWGFPSGHAASAVLLCGFAAWILSRSSSRREFRAGTWAVACLIVLITGYGRLMVGAHWPSDVTGAVLWTSAALCFVLTFGRAEIQRRVEQRATGPR